MVRASKVIALSLAIIACMLPLAAQASAAEVYVEGGISTSVVSLFKDFAPNLSTTNHYVLYRSGQYTYDFVYGDGLTLSGTVFSGSDLSVLRLTATSGMNSHYTISSFFADLDLDVSDLLVYSNLGFYPDIYTRSDYLVFNASLICAIGLCCYLTGRIFSFCLRRRG